MHLIDANAGRCCAITDSARTRHLVTARTTAVSCRCQRQIRLLATGTQDLVDVDHALNALRQRLLISVTSNREGGGEGADIAGRVVGSWDKDNGPSVIKVPTKGGRCPNFGERIAQRWDSVGLLRYATA